MLIDFVRLEIQFKGNQCSLARGRVKGPIRHKSPVQQLPDQWPLSTPPVNSQVEVSVSTAGIDTSQLDGSAEHIRDGGNDAPDVRKYETHAADAVRQAEFAKQQATVMAQQAELITRLQHKTEHLLRIKLPSH